MEIAKVIGRLMARAGDLIFLGICFGFGFFLVALVAGSDWFLDVTNWIFR